MKNLIKVQLIVFVDCSSTWGDDCTIGQVKKQAIEEALHIAQRSLKKDPLVKKVEFGEVTLNVTL